MDPDGHCVEVTCARPQAEWRWQNGRPVLVADPLELRDFSAEPGWDLPFDGLPAGTELGHVQLKVTDPDLTATEPFYCDLLGFDVEGYPHDLAADALHIRDPSGNLLRFTVAGSGAAAAR
ncbi:hypothetical protein AB0C38_45700 [Amycolatopsis sp. NPDC048633]|uniref:hypothetical protein n=1 Tax=Amycolatopsis sp. NPDC048633 TaxID=3157095 RepID=UPI003411D48B